MNNTEKLYSEISSRYGAIQRARGCFLYTRKGIRLTDLYQEGGRAILGWGGGSAFSMFKNTMNRGLTGSFDTDYSYRTEKAVSELLNSKRKIFFYYSKDQALKNALLISPSGTSFYKPWNLQNNLWQNVDVVVLEAPLPWAEPIFVVAAKVDLIRDVELILSKSERIPAALHSGITRSIYDLISAIKERQEKDWFLYDKIINKYFDRKGPYLYPKVPEEKYFDFVSHCLDCQLIISPLYNVPSIVPFGADIGNFSKLKNNPFEF